MQATFASLVGAAIGKLSPGGREFSANDLVLEGRGPLTAAERRKVRGRLMKLIKAGEIARVRPGVYRVARRVRKPQLQQVMWNILRFRRKVTIEDLVELSGATGKYAREWLDHLTRRGFVRHARLKDAWQLISDPVAMPRNESKAERLRKMRRKKRARIMAS